MRNRLLWVFVAVAAVSAAALFIARFKAGPRRNPEVAIQDGKTIDFSSGRPVVKDTAKEKASIDKAVKEMDEASKGITFSSPSAPPAKKAETKK